MFFGGLVYVGIKNEMTTRRVNGAVYNREGDPKLQSITQCEKCRAECQANRDKDRTELRVELQAIHRCIQELPGQIIGLIRDMKQ